MNSVFIAGGGASGALAALHLLRTLPEGRVFLADPKSVFGAGAAYGPLDRSFLLNVRAGGMSAFPEAPNDFAEWLGGDQQVFAPRWLYGEYLRARLSQEAARSKAHFVPLKDEVVAIKRGEPWTVAIKSGAIHRAGHVILAMGNRPPTVPPALEGLVHQDGFEGVPWSGASLDKVGAEDPVLIVGTGLTMADICCSLAKRGHHGPIRAVSRRGLIPQPHGASEAVPFEWNSEAPLLRQVVRWVRENGDNWRGAIDGMRPHTPALWKSMSQKDRNAFLTRLQPFWEVHRHRLPPESFEILSDLMERGQLEVVKGGIQSAHKDGLFHTLTAGQWFACKWIFLATGPRASLADSPGRLLASLLHEEIVRLDPLGLGIEADERGLCSGHESLWALGPLLKGVRWESTAVPEIRVQARDIAQAIAESQTAPSLAI